jgi:hypothetical protein
MSRTEFLAVNSFCRLAHLSTRQPRMKTKSQDEHPSVGQRVISKRPNDSDELKLCCLSFACGTVAVIFYDFEISISNGLLPISTDGHCLASSAGLLRKEGSERDVSRWRPCYALVVAARADAETPQITTEKRSFCGEDRLFLLLLTKGEQISLSDDS